MKKKTRSITVDQCTYAWRVVHDKLRPDQFVWLRVWRPGDKQPWACLLYRFNDPWLCFGELLSAIVQERAAFQLTPLMPAQVARLIRLLPKEGGWFSVSDTGECMPYQDASV